ncbi:plasmid replication protein RepC [Methylorubrum thiocyanatum]|uniref:plasmid replication protein RepC n=1 Tax=Methylorubrum thiocyanatum TaxID=47958 RepID=UPI003F7D6F9F
MLNDAQAAPAAARLTAPFGRRPLTAGQIRGQAAADACPAEAVAHKWTVLHDLTAARDRLELSAQSLTVLEALLTFHPDTTLTPGEGAALVVFPSNSSLGARARGLSEASLRRHLAALVEAGLLIRRDSPNGKRYARRGNTGEVAQAFGFDLTPLVARADEIATLAEQCRAEALAHRIARERLTLLRRDCTKLLDALEATAVDEGAGEVAPSPVLRARLSALLARLPRRPTTQDLTTVADGLEALAVEASKLLMPSPESSEMSGSASQVERHIQSSKADVPVYEPAAELGQKAPLPASTSPDRHSEHPAVTRSTYPLGMVLDACPQIRDYARYGVRSWADLVETAGLVRGMLGISPHAWNEARGVMGEDAAAVTVAAILERAEHIKSPGGYLRALVEKKREGRFSLGPVLQALNRAQLSGQSPLPAGVRARS